jgi:hypothetical protein
MTWHKINPLVVLDKLRHGLADERDGRVTPVLQASFWTVQATGYVFLLCPFGRIYLFLF